MYGQSEPRCVLDAVHLWQSPVTWHFWCMLAKCWCPLNHILKVFSGGHLSDAFIMNSSFFFKIECIQLFWAKCLNVYIQVLYIDTDTLIPCFAVVLNSYWKNPKQNKPRTVVLFFCQFVVWYDLMLAFAWKSKNMDTSLLLIC